MNYKELAELILTWDEERQSADITIYEDDEFYPAALEFVGDDDADRLDPGHPFFVAAES